MGSPPKSVTQGPSSAATIQRGISRKILDTRKEREAEGNGTDSRDLLLGEMQREELATEERFNEIVIVVGSAMSTLCWGGQGDCEGRSSHTNPHTDRESTHMDRAHTRTGLTHG